MKNLIAFTVVSLVLSIVLLSGCTGSTNENSKNPDFSKIVGTWTSDTDRVERTFLSNGAVQDTTEGYDGTWNISNHKIVFVDVFGDRTEFSYEFSNNDNTLQLRGEGKTMTLTRKS